MMNLIGIDKTVIKGFTVNKIEMDKLLSKSNQDNVMCLRKSINKYNYWGSTREDNFNTIMIQDNDKFNYIKIDVKNVGEKGFKKYGILDMSVAVKGENNLVPLSVGAYKQKVKEVFRYIQERYGIYMDTSALKFKEIEVNATLELDNDFEDYVRTLKVLVGIAPKTYSMNTVLTDHRKSKVNMYEVSNDSIKCKFYDKSEQLREVYDFEISNALLRIEYTLKNTRKIQEGFSHDELAKLTDVEMKGFFKEQFKKDFTNNWEKMRLTNKAKLVKLCKECKVESRQWLKLFLMTIMNEEVSSKILLFDIEDLREVFQVVDKKNVSQCMRAIYKLPPRTVDSYTGVNDKISEVVNKINAIE